MFGAEIKNFKTADSSEKGISLLITFFVMSISLAVFLGVSAILFSGIRMIREMGYSASAFYMADTGIEKTLYYDQKVIPDQAKRGLCAIVCSPAVSECSPTCDDCYDGSISGEDCGVETCGNCTVSYKSDFDSARKFSVETTVNPETEIMTSVGSYKGVKRAIEITAAPFILRDFGPRIISAEVDPRSVPEGVLLVIRAEVDPRGVDIDKVYVHIRKSDWVAPEIYIMNKEASNDDYISYKIEWRGEEGVYYADIEACDINEECVLKYNI